MPPAAVPLPAPAQSFELESCEQLLCEHLPVELSCLTRLQRVCFSHQHMVGLPWQLTGLSQVSGGGAGRRGLAGGKQRQGARETVSLAWWSSVPSALPVA